MYNPELFRPEQILKEVVVTLETVFAILLLTLSTLILVKTRRTKNQFLINEAGRCFSQRCEVKDHNSINFEGRLYTQGTALLRNKKTGELKFINQAKTCDIGLIG